MCVCSFIHAFNIYVSSSRFHAFGEEAASEPQTLLLEPKAYIGWKGKEFKRGEREGEGEKRGKRRGGEGREQYGAEEGSQPFCTSSPPFLPQQQCGKEDVLCPGGEHSLLFLIFQLTSILV